jgi:non-specific serine/threonine protein kinase
VGREREIAELEKLLSGEARLLTLIGPGGCGKTRLALSAAFRLAGDFESGVWWVELAPLSDPDLVAQAVARALGVREAPGRSQTEALLEHLENRKVLLVLDNCEHLVEGCAALADAMLRSCPGLRVLATSREALSIVGERTWPVPPLSSPTSHSLPPIEKLRSYEATSLFVERANAVVPTFGLTEQNAPTVAKLCRILDGMPLAIELAAARVRLLSVEQISSRLGDSLALLTGGSRTALPHQRTLRAAMDWSYELLSKEEQVLLGRLSVFAGGSPWRRQKRCVAEKVSRRGGFQTRPYWTCSRAWWTSR